MLSMLVKNVKTIEREVVIIDGVSRPNASVCAAAAKRRNSACSIKFWHLIESIQKFLFIQISQPFTQQSVLSAMSVLRLSEAGYGSGIVILSSHTFKKKPSTSKKKRIFECNVSAEKQAKVLTAVNP